jgi:hypothetical protein
MTCLCTPEPLPDFCRPKVEDVLIQDTFGAAHAK